MFGNKFVWKFTKLEDYLTFFLDAYVYHLPLFFTLQSYFPHTILIRKIIHRIQLARSRVMNGKYIIKSLVSTAPQDRKQYAYAKTAKGWSLRRLASSSSNSYRKRRWFHDPRNNETGKRALNMYWQWKQKQFSVKSEIMNIRHFPKWVHIYYIFFVYFTCFDKKKKRKCEEQQWTVWNERQIFFQFSFCSLTHTI